LSPSPLPVPCLDCRVATTPGPRCPAHTADRRRVRNADRAIARAVVAASPVCEDCGATDDLTAHHVVPLARGGTNDGPRAVLCRSCNAKRGAR